MKSSISVTNRKQNASFRIVGRMLAIGPLWLMLAAVNMSARAQTSATPSPADWTEFHRDNMQRWNQDEDLLNVKNVGTLKLKWSFAEGITGDQEYSFTSPVVTNGILYASAYDGTLFALNAATGEKLWSDLVAAGSTPAVSKGILYVGGLDSVVHALNAITGTALWSFNTGGYLESAPTVVNGVVYIGSTDGNLYALNARTGRLLWSYFTESVRVRDESVALFSSPAVANGVVYIGTADGDLLALNASTGTKLWIDAGFGGFSSPAVANGTVYSCGSDHIYALNGYTGAIMWSAYAEPHAYCSPAEANGVVYVGLSDGSVYALNASTGAMMWKNTVTGSIDMPAVANGVVYIGSSDGTLYALSAVTGAKLWSYSTGVPIVSGASIVNGVIYLHGGGPFGLDVDAFALGGTSDLFLRVIPSTTTVHQGDLLTYAFPVWNLGTANADHEVLNTQVPAGTTFDYIRISGTPGLSTCTHPPYQRTGQIVCHENGVMAANTTWTVRLTVKVTAPAGTVITENAATMADTPDPNLANNTATVSITVQ